MVNYSNTSLFQSRRNGGRRLGRHLRATLGAGVAAVAQGVCAGIGALQEAPAVLVVSPGGNCIKIGLPGKSILR